MIIPVRWCGIEGAPSMTDPAIVGETSTDDVLRARHERAAAQIYLPYARMVFQAGTTASPKHGITSFPIIRDPSGTDGNIASGEEAEEAVMHCQEAWKFGDPLYYDFDEDGIVSRSNDRLLSVANPDEFLAVAAHDGAPLKALPESVKFIDEDQNGLFGIGEHIYRDENSNGLVDSKDTLLSPASQGTNFGVVNPRDLMAELLPTPSKIKYLDLVRQPVNSYSIGSPAVRGITAISANDLDIPDIGFPIHGIALGLCQDAVVMDDPSFYLPPGSDYQLFETQLIAHEFGHAFCLDHGDGFDDDENGILDDGDDPVAPFEGAGPGTLCDSNNVMQYCWRDLGSAANPVMNWLGIGEPGSGVFTEAQVKLMRDHARAIPDVIIDPGPYP